MRDVRTVGLHGEDGAALHRLTVDVDRAGAARRRVAADVGAGQARPARGCTGRASVRGSTSFVCCSPLTVTLISTEWPPSKVKRCPCVIMTRGSGTAESAVSLVVQLLGEVVLDADLADRLQLRLEPVDVLLLGRRGSRASSSRVPLSPLATHAAMPLLRRSTAAYSSSRSSCNCSATVSPTRTGKRRCMFGTPSRKRMRSMIDVGVLHLVDRLLAAVLGEAVVAPVARTSWRG